MEQEFKPKLCPICVHCDKTKVSYGISNHDGFYCVVYRQGATMPKLGG